MAEAPSIPEDDTYLRAVSRQWWVLVALALTLVGYFGLDLLDMMRWSPWVLAIFVLLGVMIAQWRAWEEMRKRARVLADRVSGLETEPVPGSHADLLRKIVGSLIHSVKNDALCNYGEGRYGIHHSSFADHFPDVSETVTAWNAALDKTHDAAVALDRRLAEEVSKCGLTDPPFYGREIVHTVKEVAIQRARRGRHGPIDFGWSEHGGQWYSWAGYMVFGADPDNPAVRAYQERIEKFFYSVEAFSELREAIQAERDQRQLQTALLARLKELSLFPRYYGSCSLCARPG